MAVGNDVAVWVGVGVFVGVGVGVNVTVAVWVGVTDGIIEAVGVGDPNATGKSAIVNCR